MGTHFSFNSMKGFYVNRYQHPDHTIQFFSYFRLRNPKKSRRKRNLIYLKFSHCRYSILPFLQEARRVLELGGFLIFSTESISEAEDGTAGTVERASERFAHSRRGLGDGNLTPKN